MRLNITFLVMALGICLNGCGVRYPGVWPDAAIHWSKKGMSHEEVRKFHQQCYPRWMDMYWRRSSRDEEISSEQFVELEIEGQICMLGHGFHFDDAPRPHGRLCSKRYAINLDVESYMIFPACQAKYGRYRK